MTSNLVRKPITDKNGVTKAHWVKPESDSSAKAVLPFPSFTPSRESEAKRIGAEVRKSMAEAKQAGDESPWSSYDETHFRILVDSGDVDSVRVIQQLVDGNVPVRPEEIGMVTRQLQKRGYDHPAGMMTKDTLEAHKTIMSALDAYGAERGIPYFSKRDGADDVGLMAFTDAKDAPRIISVVTERGMMSPEEIRDIVAQMNEVIVPLQNGAL